MIRGFEAMACAVESPRAGRGYRLCQYAALAMVYRVGFTIRLTSALSGLTHRRSFVLAAGAGVKAITPMHYRFRSFRYYHAVRRHLDLGVVAQEERDRARHE
jgi:hypothetical protein